MAALRDDEDPEEWRKTAKCFGQGLSHLFYPERSNAEVQQAKAVCNGHDGGAPCPVRTVCLEYALSHNERFGVWGGTSERERRKIQRKRRAANGASQRRRQQGR